MICTFSLFVEKNIKGKPLTTQYNVTTKSLIYRNNNNNNFRRYNCEYREREIRKHLTNKTERVIIIIHSGRQTTTNFYNIIIQISMLNGRQWTRYFCKAVHSYMSNSATAARIWIRYWAGLLHGAYTASILIGFHSPLKTDWIQLSMNPVILLPNGINGFPFILY
jgi:hypothetical protein